MRVDLAESSEYVYLDTNVFIYSIDSHDEHKHRVARDVVSRLFEKGTGVFSAQVMAEWRNVMIRKYADRVGATFRADFLAWLASLNPHPVTGELVCRAERLCRAYSFSPYDAMHVQAALEMKCRYFLSEDMQDGLRVNNDLEIVNPFA